MKSYKGKGRKGKGKISKAFGANAGCFKGATILANYALLYYSSEKGKVISEK